MRAMAIVGHGGVEQLQWCEVPDPVQTPGQVLVRVRAVGLNHLDLWVRKGLPGLRVPMPHCLGSDIAGVVEQADVGSGFVKGDAVIVQPGLSCMRCPQCLAGQDNLCTDYKILGEHVGGGYAPLLNVPLCNVVPKPAALSFEEAACVPVAYLTAWQMLMLKARIQPLQSVFIHAIGSGVGIAALQIAQMMGCRVMGTASSPAKRARAQAMGVQTVLDPAQDWVTAVKQLTDKQGVDVVFEHTGEATWPGSILIAKRGGCIVTCGATSGFAAMTDLRHVFFRQISIMGSTMGPKSTLHTLLAHMQRGALKPQIERVFPVGQAQEAHELLASRQAFGKIVLTHA